MIGLPVELNTEELGVTYVADESIQSGCVVETNFGELDLQLDQMWEQLRVSIEEAFKSMSLWEKRTHAVDSTPTGIARGVVTDLTGLIIERNGPSVGVGSTCKIVQGSLEISAQVVGFKRDRVLLMPLADMTGIAPGAVIQASGIGDSVPVGAHLLGRVLDPMMEPLDGRPLPKATESAPLMQTTIPARTN